MIKDLVLITQGAIDPRRKSVKGLIKVCAWQDLDASMITVVRIAASLAMGSISVGGNHLVTLDKIIQTKHHLLLPKCQTHKVGLRHDNCVDL